MLPAAVNSSRRLLGISPLLAPLLPLISLWGEVLSWPFLLPLPVGEGWGEGEHEDVPRHTQWVHLGTWNGRAS